MPCTHTVSSDVGSRKDLNRVKVRSSGSVCFSLCKKMPSMMGRRDNPTVLVVMVAAAVVAPFLLSVCEAQQCGREGNFALCDNNACCSKWSYCGFDDDYCGEGCQSGPCSGGGGAGPSPGEGRVQDIVSRNFFETQFPNRHSVYTYDAFIRAAEEFPRFGTTGDDGQKKREIAAFLAHIDHETTGLRYVEEINPQGDYCDGKSEWPCVPGKRYFGRGPLQLSWNFNYGQFGDAIRENLLSQPERVAREGVMAFKSAIWFWSTTQWNKPSCHAVMTGSWIPTSNDNAANRRPGFGVTINIINGRLECNQNSAEADRRVEYYRKFCRELGSVNPGENLDCRNQRSFDS